MITLPVKGSGPGYGIGVGSALPDYGVPGLYSKTARCRVQIALVVRKS